MGWKSDSQKLSRIQKEFILLSDILGLSLLVDSIDHPKPPGSTEGTVLGPFHTHDVSHVEDGAQIIHDPLGEPLLVLCAIRDTAGNPIQGVKVDIWETDSTGHYDVQRSDYESTGPDGRCIMHSNEKGEFWFRAVKPVPYPIPHDGPVGKLLKSLSRHPYRPSHMHFMFEKEGYDNLITYVHVHALLITFFAVSLMLLLFPCTAVRGHNVSNSMTIEHCTFEMTRTSPLMPSLV